MNTKLTIDAPVGEGWRYSLDPEATPDTYQTSPVFDQDQQGNAFVDGQTYTVYFHHVGDNHSFDLPIRFWAGPVDYALKPDADVPDLAQVMRRGSASPRVATLGGVRSKNWPEVSVTARMYVELIDDQGFSAQALLTLPQLARLLSPYFNLGNVDPLPKYIIKRIWRFVPDEGVEPLPSYIIKRIWRFVPDEAQVRPAAPSELEVILTEDGRYKLKLKDNSNNEASFVIVRATNDGSFGPYISLPANAILSGFLPDIVALAGTTYRFQAQAVNGAGASGWSNVATLSFTPLPPAQLITALQARVVSLGGGLKRLEIKAISSQALEVEFRFYDQGGAIGGYYAPITAAYGPQTFTTQFDNTPAGPAPEYTAVEVRQAGTDNQHYGPCAINIANLNGAWTTLLPI